MGELVQPADGGEGVLVTSLGIVGYPPNSYATVLTASPSE